MGRKIEIEDDEELLESLKNENDADDEFPFVSIDIQRLTKAGRNISCDVFIMRSNNKMTRVFSKESGLDFKRLNQYIDKGVAEVYVQREDWDIFMAHINRTPDQIIIDDDASREEKISALIDIADQSVAEFFTEVPVRETSVEKMKVVVRQMVKSLTNEPDLLGAIMRMAQSHEYMLGHAITVSVIAMLIARHAKNTNERMLEICGAGGFLHDIGKCQLNPEIVNAYSKLTPEQWKEMRHHPKLGVRMLDRCENVSDEVKLVVMQHHEQPGGGGYPDGLRGPRIFFPAKIVAIADGFASMISNETTGRVYSPREAIIEMQNDVGKYDRELLAVAEDMFTK